MEATHYRHKAIEVEAIEVAQLLAAASNGSMDLAPKWVRDAIFEKRVVIGLPQFYGIQVLPLPGVARFGAARDWLVHDPKDNTINVIPPETLELLYDLLYEEAPAGTTHEAKTGRRVGGPVE